MYRESREAASERPLRGRRSEAGVHASLRDLRADGIGADERAAARVEDAGELTEEHPVANGDRRDVADRGLAGLEVRDRGVARIQARRAARRVHRGAALGRPARAACAAAVAVDDHLAAAGRDRERRHDRHRPEVRPASNRLRNTAR